ncbi:MAG TPA: tetratricopeptide repeat protein [Bryobacteraceae bacterium]|jgi:tetratricopeptide (TPR) repeat protein
MMTAAFVLSLGMALQTVSPEAAAHARAGLEAQKQGHLDTAIAEFKKVTELAPTLPAAFVNLGAAYFQNRDFGAAIAPLKRSLELKPDLPGAEQMLGYALLSRGYVAEAVPYLEKTHTQDALGIAQVRLGKFSEAIPNLNAALARRPNDPELLYYLGRAAGLLSKEANDTLQEKFPNSGRAHQALAENYAVLRQIPEAERDYREALRLNPAARGVHLALGELYAKIPDWPKAEIEFRAETELQPGDAESAYWLGSTLLEEGKIKEAQAELARANRLRPDMPQTLLALGRAEMLAGDRSAAEDFWKKLLSIEDSGALAAQAHFALAGLYRKQGKAAEAAHEMEAYQRMK